MQWNAARLRPRINFNLHHHGASFTRHPDGDICNDLRPIVWVSVSIQPLCKGLLLALVLWDILLWTAKQENLLYIPSTSGPERTVFDDTLLWFSLSPPDVVVTPDGTEFLNVTAYAFCFGRLLWGLLLLVLTVATSFALATVAPRGTVSVQLWLLALVRALHRLGCNLGMTNSFEMINTLALVASFPICGAVASLMRFATFATTLAIVTTATGPSLRQCMSR